MSNKICSIVGESITFATGDLVRSFAAPTGATGVEIRGAALANDGFQFSPKLQGAWWSDNGTWSDLSSNVSEKGLQNFAEIDSFHQTQDSFYVGCAVPFRGVYINIKAANGTASVVTWTYRKSDGTWADTSDTDGTASGGATLAIDNAVTWTVPSDWIPSRLTESETGATDGRLLFWVKMNVSATLDSDTQIAEIIPMNIQPSIDGGATALGGGDTPVLVATAAAAPRYWFDPAHVGGVEITAANTEVVRIEWLITSPQTRLYRTG